jgi:hypothetical protein
MLTSNQLEEFYKQGYLVIKGAFSKADSLNWVRAECARLGYDLDKPETWTKEYARITTERATTAAELSPIAWEAACDLMGGQHQVVSPVTVNLFAVNFRQGADRPYQPASPHVGGWHIDGWNFRHFLDSPEQGLLGIPLMTDVLPEGGGTFVAADSVAVISRYLADHPEGVTDFEMPIKDLVSQCHDFREVTGDAGDFFLLHPFTLHAVSQNKLKLPRAISNLCYSLKEPMQLSRPDKHYSPVETAILRGLGVKSYDFTPSQDRYKTPDGGPINPAWR